MRMEATEMTKKRSDKKTKLQKNKLKEVPKKEPKKTAKKKSNNGKKSYSGIITDPYDRKITGRVYLKDDENYNGLKYGTVVILAALAAMAATFSSFGNATIDYFGLTGISASGIWIMFAAAAGVAGFFFAIMDKGSKGKY